MAAVMLMLILQMFCKLCFLFLPYHTLLKHTFFHDGFPSCFFGVFFSGYGYDEKWAGVHCIWFLVSVSFCLLFSFFFTYWLARHIQLPRC